MIIFSDINLGPKFSTDGWLQPLCALYRVKSCLNAAERLLNNNKIPPVRQLLENIETRRVEFRELMDLRDSKTFFINLNTPEDCICQQPRRQLGNLCDEQ